MDVLYMSHAVHRAVERGRALGGRGESVHARVGAHVSAVRHHHGVVGVSRDEHRLRGHPRRPELRHLGVGVGGGAVHVTWHAWNRARGKRTGH